MLKEREREGAERFLRVFSPHPSQSLCRATIVSESMTLIAMLIEDKDCTNVCGLDSVFVENNEK